MRNMVKKIAELERQKLNPTGRKAKIPRKEPGMEAVLADALRLIYAAYLGIDPARLDVASSARDHRLSQVWNQEISDPKMVVIMRDNVVKHLGELRRTNNRLEAVLDPLCYYVKEYMDRPENKGE